MVIAVWTDSSIEQQSSSSHSGSASVPTTDNSNNSDTDTGGSQDVSIAPAAGDDDDKCDVKHSSPVNVDNIYTRISVETKQCASGVTANGCYDVGRHSADTSDSVSHIADTSDSVNDLDYQSADTSDSVGHIVDDLNHQSADTSENVYDLGHHIADTSDSVSDLDYQSADTSDSVGHIVDDLNHQSADTSENVDDLGRHSADTSDSVSYNADTSDGVTAKPKVSFFTSFLQHITLLLHSFETLLNDDNDNVACKFSICPLLTSTAVCWLSVILLFLDPQATPFAFSCEKSSDIKQSVINQWYC